MSEKMPTGYHKGRIKKTKKLFWFNDGKMNIRLPENSEIPEGFVKGRIKWKKE